MRSFFRYLFANRITRHPDTFGMTRERLWDSIAGSIRLQQSMGKSVWLLAHFPETYLACQAMLEQHEIDYFVETDGVSTSWFFERSAAGAHVRLLLGDLIKPIEFEDDVEVCDLKIAMMAVERHPYEPVDDRLLAFASSLPAKVEVGYFLAIDDELVKRLVPDQLIDLLKAMGLQDHDLITSSLVTRRLKKLIGRMSETAQAVEGAESALAWFETQEGASL